MNKLRQAYKKKFSNYKDKPWAYRGFIGNLATSEIDVPDEPFTVYVTTLQGEVQTAINTSVPNLLGQPIFIGRDPNNMPLKTCVLGVWDVFPGSYAGMSGVGSHAKTHSWYDGTHNGSDVTWVWGEQVLMSLVFPVPGSMTVLIWPGNFWTGTQWVFIKVNTLLDFTASIPATSGKVRYAVIVLDSSGAYQIRNGVEVTGWSNITEADMPTLIAGDIPQWAVRVYSGQTQLRFNGDVNDFVDLRWCRMGGSGGGGSWSGTPGRVPVTDATGLLVTDSSIIWNNVYKSLSVGDNPPPPVNRKGSIHSISDQENATVFAWTYGNVYRSAFIGWLARGTKSSPTPVQTDDILSGVSGGGYDGVTLAENTVTSGQVRVVADENFVVTAHGTRIELFTTPIGSVTRRATAVFQSDGSLNLPVSGATYNVAGVPHTHAVATTSLAGFMSSVDKMKLDAASLTPTALTLATWDANRNMHTNAPIVGLVTALNPPAGPYTLTSSAAGCYAFTGSWSLPSVNMPSLTTLQVGMSIRLINRTGSSISVYLSDGTTLIASLSAGNDFTFTSLAISSDSVSNWRVNSSVSTTASLTVSAPLTGGGPLTGNSISISIPAAAAGVDGYMSAATYALVAALPTTYASLASPNTFAGGQTFATNAGNTEAVFSGSLSASTSFSIYMNTSFTNSSGANYGAYLGPTQTVSGGQMVGATIAPTYSAASGDLPVMYGLIVQATLAGAAAGHLNTAQSLYLQLVNSSAAGGVIDTGYALHILAPVGTVTSPYAIVIDANAGPIALGEGINIGVGTSTGTKIGLSTSGKLGFFGATPIIQPSGSAQAAAPAGGTGTAAGGWDTAAHRNSAIATINALRQALVDLGIIKGSA